MKKRIISAKKSKPSSPKKGKLQLSYYHYIIIVSLVLLSIPATKFIASTFTTPHVLGAKTYLAQNQTSFFDFNFDSLFGGQSYEGSPTIVQQNTQSQTSTGGTNTLNQQNIITGIPNSTGGQTGTTTQQGAQITQTQSNTQTGSGTNTYEQVNIIDKSTTNINEGTGTVTTSSTGGSSVVDCVGPDGKHSTATLEECIALNRTYNNKVFNFTILRPSTTTRTTIPTQQFIPPGVTITPTPLPSLQTNFEQSDKLPDDFQEKMTKFQQQLKDLTEQIASRQTAEIQQGVQIQLPAENVQDNISVTLPDGDQIPVMSDAIQIANQVLQEQNIVIERTEDDRLAIKKDNIDVLSELPITVDIKGQSLILKTPQGEQELAILPDQAINALKRQGVMSEIQSQAQVVNDQALISQIANLTTLNDQPVYEIQGVANKKLLGIIPVSYAKKAFVSTETGDVVKTEESIWGKILEQFSL